MSEILTGFIDNGSDEALLKSLQVDENIDQEELVKALDKSKLVQVERQVQGKNKMFTRKQWVKAGDVQSSDKVIGEQPQKDDKSKYTSIGKKDTSDIKTGDIVKLELKSGDGYNIFEVLRSEPSKVNDNSQRVTIKYLEAADHRIKTGENGVVSTATWDHGKSFEVMKKQEPQSSNNQTNKPKATYFKADQATKNTVNNIAQKMGNDKLLSWCNSVGVTWTENDHKGINTMRAKMSLAQAIQEGKVSVDTKTSEKSDSSESNDTLVPKSKSLEIPKPNEKLSQHTKKYAHGNYMQGDPARDIAYVLDDPNSSISRIVNYKNEDGSKSVDKLMNQQKIREYMDEQVKTWQDKVKSDIDKLSTTGKSTQFNKTRLQQLVDQQKFVLEISKKWEDYKSSSPVPKNSERNHNS